MTEISLVEVIVIILSWFCAGLYFGFNWGIRRK